MTTTTTARIEAGMTALQSAHDAHNAQVSMIATLHNLGLIGDDDRNARIEAAYEALNETRELIASASR